MKDTIEKKVWRLNGFAALLVTVAAYYLAYRLLRTVALAMGADEARPAAFWWAVVIIVLASLGMRGFFVIHPNEAKAFTFAGSYVGSLRDQGFHWTNPFAVKKAVMLRVRNFASQVLKVNDAHGNPIEIGAVVVWRVVDSAKALFNVDNYESFVVVQAETAIRFLAGRFPYDAPQDQESLRGSQDEVATELRAQLRSRLSTAGIEIDEARLSHLAYAPEIAQAMLRKQQAGAVIEARRLIVDGAVGMVRMALSELEEQGVVTLDEERKASMVNNLLVALVSESEAQPVINTGSLYS
ncbi:MAG TPA: SPFH domain-containing protein [Rectinemataceae bacterium]|nr:SPFH domain-containing protein [Rectinemataceae bacterium]